jgi:hypothetical protein
MTARREWVLLHSNTDGSDTTEYMPVKGGNPPGAQP